MNETYEQEIDLKWLIYRVLRGWRTIVVWAIIVGVVLGIGSFGLNYVKINDPEYIEAEQENFEREHTSWVATGENFKAQLENIAEARAEQEEYNEKSVLMQIDPLREFHASFELYVNYDYRIMPDMTYQNIDLSDRILNKKILTILGIVLCNVLATIKIQFQCMDETSYRYEFFSIFNGIIGNRKTVIGQTIYFVLIKTKIITVS